MKAEEVKILIVKYVNNMMQRIYDRLNLLEQQLELIINAKQEEMKHIKMGNENQINHNTEEFITTVNLALQESFKIIQNQEIQNSKNKETNNKIKIYLEGLQQIYINPKLPNAQSNLQKMKESQYITPTSQPDEISLISNYSKNDKNQMIVFITQYGNNYHKENCVKLLYSKIPVTKQIAQKNGLSACNLCQKSN